MPLWALLKTGGVTIYILIGCSILSLAIILERLFYYRKRGTIKRTAFMVQIIDAVEKGNIKKALRICEDADTPFSNVVLAGLNLSDHDEVIISNTMAREITIETNKLERYTSIIGTLGSTAVYIGLFGTVLGIIRAFHDISESGTGGISIVINGISEALVCTAAGLAVAVPAVIAYNYFIKRIDNFIIDMELCTSQTMDLINIRKKWADDHGKKD